MVVRQSNKAFGLMFAVVFALVGVVAYVAFDAALAWSAVVAGLFVLAALVVPGVLMPLNRLWGLFAAGLGQFNNRLILGLFFFAFVTPVGLLMRAVGNDPMARKRDAEAKTYFTPVRRHASPENYSDLF